MYVNDLPLYINATHRYVHIVVSLLKSMKFMNLNSMEDDNGVISLHDVMSVV
jgi:hypothetical protein